MLSNELTVGRIEVYQRRATDGLSACFFRLRVTSTRPERGRLHAGTGDVHVQVTGDELVVDVVALTLSFTS
jgi:hypothetical protein